MYYSICIYINVYRYAFSLVYIINLYFVNYLQSFPCLLNLLSKLIFKKSYFKGLLKVIKMIFFKDKCKGMFLFKTV